MNEYTTVELKKEIHRREEAVREGKCWFCHQSLISHTCIHAKPSQIPGWQLENPVFREEGGGCMANEAAHWVVWAKRDEINTYMCGIGFSIEEATQNCIENIKRRYQ